jgi:hypothetical protein
MMLPLVLRLGTSLLQLVRKSLQVLALVLALVQALVHKSLLVLVLALVLRR